MGSPIETRTAPRTETSRRALHAAGLLPLLRRCRGAQSRRLPKRRRNAAIKRPLSTSLDLHIRRNGVQLLDTAACLLRGHRLGDGREEKAGRKRCALIITRERERESGGGRGGRAAAKSCGGERRRRPARASFAAARRCK